MEIQTFLRSDALLKELSNVKKHIDIAKARSITLTHIVELDLMYAYMLFYAGNTAKPVTCTVLADTRIEEVF